MLIIDTRTIGLLTKNYKKKEGTVLPGAAPATAGAATATPTPTPGGKEAEAAEEAVTEAAEEGLCLVRCY